MIKKNQIALLLLLINLWAGFLFMNDGLFYHDSVVLAQAVENTQITGVLQPAIRGRYGSVVVNYLISLPSLIVGHNADFAIRFSSVLFHALSIVALFLFLSMLFENLNIGFFAALLFSFTPLYFSPNTYGKEHGMSVFFLLVSFIILYRGLKKESIMLIVFSSALLIFSVTVRESMLGAIPLFFLLFFDPRLDLKHKARLLFSASFVVLVCLGLVMGLYLGKVLYGALFIQDFAATRFLGLFTIKTYFSLLAGVPYSLLVLLCIFFIIGASKLYQDKQWFLGIFFLIWFFIFVYQANNSSACPRFLDMAVIAAYVFIAYALADLFKKDKIFASVFILFFVLSMLLFMAPMVALRSIYNGQKQFAQFVYKNTENNAIVIAQDEAPFIEYYAKRFVRKPPIGNAVKIKEFFRSLDTTLRQGVPVYLIKTGLGYDFYGLLKKGFWGNFKMTLIGQKLNEDYHRSEHKFSLFFESLYKISLKDSVSLESQ